ncbi:Translocon-associated protein subunit alpha [Liparis tanakae]|uniref:Translocon-associated protein subunit alpha n=1 Tax=Liparis tanakae TaxID=230148 RepID=A0A4Z2FTJ3_9TELE|nr:Translocon-associated protein subunit alpha [Liparis tanakae]
MFNFGSKMLLLLLLAFPCGLISIGQVSADSDSDEDIAEDIAEDPDAAVDEEEDEEEVLVEQDQMQPLGKKKKTQMKVLINRYLLTLMSTQPSSLRQEKGSQEFTVQSLEASFRYPQDFQFYIQNFTALPLSTVVQPQTQASFEYSFIPAQPMAGRPFGLVILLNYLDTEGNGFQTAIYNQTVTIIELDEGMDGETIFLYIFLVGLVSLMLFGVYQVLETRTKKRISAKIEKGTGGMSDVDISWLPQETLNIMNKASPKASPRKRTNRAAGADQ